MKEKTMKALVYHGPDQISLDDVPMPEIKDPNDAIAKVTVNTICTSDVHIMKGEIPFVKAPRVLGHEFCVEVIEIGDSVMKVEVGKHYLSAPLSYCGECDNCRIGRLGACENAGGFGIYTDGCQAEYVRIPYADKCLVEIPKGRTDEDMLLLGDMLATAWFGIQNAQVKPGQMIAVVGCGPVGLSACELLTKHFGCTCVALDIISERAQLAVDNGVAVAAINPELDDVDAKVKELTGGKGFPAIIECAGTGEAYNLSIAIAGYSGMVSTVSVFSEPVTIPMQTLVYKNLRFATGIQRCEGFPAMITDIVLNKIDTNWILTHKSPLNEIIKGYDVFGNKKDSCTKWVITPYEA